MIDQTTWPQTFGDAARIVTTTVPSGVGTFYGYSVPTTGVYAVTSGFGFVPTALGTLSATLAISSTIAGSFAPLELVLVVNSPTLGTSTIIRRAAVSATGLVGVQLLVNYDTMVVAGKLLLNAGDIVVPALYNNTLLDIDISIATATNATNLTHYWFDVLYDGPPM